MLRLFGIGLAGVGLACSILWSADHAVIGLTSKRNPIEAVSVRGDSADAATVLVIGGLRGQDDDATARVRRLVRDLEAKKRRPHRLLAIPLANPDQSSLEFPPIGVAYRDNTESHYLWRWIMAQAPDLVVIAGEDSGLAKALSGRIPTRVLDSKPLPREIAQSPSHIEMDRRRNRSPRQLAEELARYYGKDFNGGTYIAAVALIGQLRLGHVAEVEKLATPVAVTTPVTTAGRLVFAELARRTNQPRYTQLVREAADLVPNETGEEMSDSVFMTCPILAAAGRLTGEPKYFERAVRHFQFMQKLCLRPDGLYRHSSLSEAAWGRGNAFPALGLALTLSDFPAEHPQFGPMLLAFQQHMAALAQRQNEDGMWREVIDEPGAYGEFSATAMIGTAMLRGIRNGWLSPESYQPIVARAWRAVSSRVGPDGSLTDVCESTGKQKSLDDYLRRAAILGPDPRGGAMGLLFATEMLDATAVAP